MPTSFPPSPARHHKDPGRILWLDRNRGPAELFTPSFAACSCSISPSTAPAPFLEARQILQTRRRTPAAMTSLAEPRPSLGHSPAAEALPAPATPPQTPDDPGPGPSGRLVSVGGRLMQRRQKISRSALRPTQPLDRAPPAPAGPLGGNPGHFQGGPARHGADAAAIPSCVGASKQASGSPCGLQLAGNAAGWSLGRPSREPPTCARVMLYHCVRPPPATRPRRPAAPPAPSPRRQRHPPILLPSTMQRLGLAPAACRRPPLLQQLRGPGAGGGGGGGARQQFQLGQAAPAA